MAEEQKLTRRQQAEETKRHIFDTAMKLLDERAFDSITVRDIVSGANVSIGSFYNYYTSKMDVYYETYHIADEYFETEVAGVLEGLPFREALFLYFDCYARYASEVTSLALTKLLYNSRNKCFDRRSPTGMFHVLSGVMQRGLQEGVLRTDESAGEIAHFFLVAMRGLMYNWCTNDGGYDIRAAARKYTERLLRAYL